MVAKSEIILSSQTHPDGTTVESVVGEKFKGDGYYGRSDGIHTVQWNLSNFTGSIKMQGSLAIDPQQDDWVNLQVGNFNEFTIDTTGKVSTLTISSIEYTEPTTGSFIYNFVGNYVWVRVVIDNWTTGTINSVLMSH